MNGRRDFLKLLGISLPAAAVAAKVAPEPEPTPEPKVEVRTIVIEPDARGRFGGYENEEILKREHEHIHRSLMESGLAAKLLTRRDPEPNRTFAEAVRADLKRDEELRQAEESANIRKLRRVYGWKPPKGDE